MDPLVRPTTERGRRAQGERSRDWTEDVGAVLALLRATDIAELEIEADGVAIRVERRPSGVVARVQPSAADEPTPIPETSNSVIAAPAVGIYRAPNGTPSEPIVAAGDAVSVGHFLGSIDAMGLATRVLCDNGGTIERIDVTDGQAVEYGQVLFTVHPD